MKQVNKYIACLCAVILSTHVYSQEDVKVRQIITLGYFGEKIFRPGLQIGYKSSHELFQGRQSHNAELGGMLGAYIHHRNHVGVRVAPSLGYRYRATNGWDVGLTTDLGFFHRFYNGRVYQVDENGNVKSKSLSGRSALSYGAYCSLGRSFGRVETKKKLDGLFLEIGFFREVGAVAGKGVTHPSLVIGVKKNLSYAK